MHSAPYISVRSIWCCIITAASFYTSERSRCARLVSLRPWGRVIFPSKLLYYFEVLVQVWRQEAQRIKTRGAVRLSWLIIIWSVFISWNIVSMCTYYRNLTQMHKYHICTFAGLQMLNLLLYACFVWWLVQTGLVSTDIMEWISFIKCLILSFLGHVRIKKQLQMHFLYLIDLCFVVDTMKHSGLF